MTREFEFYHGLALTRLIHGSPRDVSVETYPTETNSSYIVNNDFGLFIKYSTKRMSPWGFTFAKEHQDEIEEMKRELGNVFVLFVCSFDGIACINYNELKVILDEVHDISEGVRVSRGRREMYAITGKNGKLGYKISDGDFPSRVFKPVVYTEQV